MGAEKYDVFSSLVTHTYLSARFLASSFLNLPSILHFHHRARISINKLCNDKTCDPLSLYIYPSGELHGKHHSLKNTPCSRPLMLGRRILRPVSSSNTSIQLDPHYLVNQRPGTANGWDIFRPLTNPRLATASGFFFRQFVRGHRVFSGWTRVLAECGVSEEKLNSISSVVGLDGGRV